MLDLSFKDFSKVIIQGTSLQLIKYFETEIPRPPSQLINFEMSHYKRSWNNLGQTNFKFPIIFLLSKAQEVLYAWRIREECIKARTVFWRYFTSLSTGCCWSICLWMSILRKKLKKIIGVALRSFMQVSA